MPSVALIWSVNTVRTYCGSMSWAVGVGADRVKDLVGALRIGDGAAVDPLGRRDRIGGRQSLGRGVNEAVQRACGFGICGSGKRAHQQRPGHQQRNTSITAHGSIMLRLSG